MWDYDFQGIIIDPLSFTDIEYAAFANVASSPFGVAITSDDVSVMTPEQRIEYMQSLDAFLDGYSNTSYSPGSDQNSYWNDYSDYAPLGADFMAQYGWMPGLSQTGGYHFYDYLTQDIDPEFLEAISNDQYQNYQANGSSLSFDLGQNLIMNGAFAGTNGFTTVWVDGPPVYTDDGTIVVTAGHWEVRAPAPGITYGNIANDGDGASFLSATLAISASLATLVDALHVDVVVKEGTVLTDAQKAIIAEFKVLVNNIAKQLSEIPDNAILTMANGSTITGAQLKAAWARVDFQINPEGFNGYRNGSARGEADWANGNPVVSFNIDLLEDYAAIGGGLEYLAFHELGHLTLAGRNLNGLLDAGGMTAAENEQNEEFANSVARAISNATGQPVLAWDPTYGYEAGNAQFAVPPPAGGDTGGGGGYGGGGGGYNGDNPIP